jgi:hypothetical protein
MHRQGGFSLLEWALAGLFISLFLSRMLALQAELIAIGEGYWH